MRRALACALVPLLAACPRPPSSTSGGQAVPVTRQATADEALQRAVSAADVSRKQGIEALMRVRRSYPDSTAGQDALHRAGVLLFEEGQYVEARDTLNQLVLENPLHPGATEARLKAGLAAVKLKAWREAQQTLQPLLESLTGEERRLAEEALREVALATHQHGEALRAAVRGVETADEAGQARAVAQLEEQLEAQATFLEVAEVYLETPRGHPAWPVLAAKMAKVYYHVRDWTRLAETLKAALETSPEGPYAAELKALQARTSRRTTVVPNRLGAVLPLTSKKYKAFGEAVLRGLKLGLEGTDIDLVVKDSQGDPAIAAKMVEALALEEGVIAIVGPLLAEDSRRAALQAEELQVPLITLSRSEGLTELGPNIFRTMVTNAQQAQALVDFSMRTLGYKTFAVLYPNTPFGVELTNAFWDAVEARGGQIRGAEWYAHDQTTFTDEAKKLVGRYYLEDRGDYHEKLKELRDARTGEEDLRARRKLLEKARDRLEPVVDFEALLLPDGWERVSLVAPALAVEDIITNACDSRDMERIQKTTGKKPRTVTLLGPSTWRSPKGASGMPQLLERGQKYVECGVYVDAFHEGSERREARAFVDVFRAANPNATITLLDVIAYDTAGMVKKVLSTRPTTREAFRERLAAMKDFPGAAGTTSFDDRREARRPLFFLKVTGKGLKELEARPEG